MQLTRRDFMKFAGLSALTLVTPRILHPQSTVDGLVRVSLADIRAEPNPESSLETQALMGTPIQIIGESEEHYEVVEGFQDYPGYMSKDNVVLIPDASQYNNGPVVMVSIRQVPILSEPAAESDVIASAHTSTFLKCTESLDDKMYEVELPDGRKGYIDRWVRFHEDGRNIPQGNQDDIIALAETALKNYDDSQYVWGGITPDGWDCSGLTSWLFRYHGHDIPRDSWQQFARTQGISYNSDQLPPSNSSLITDIRDLRPADLAFFNESNTSGITHVGIIDNDGKMIHASQGMQRVSGASLGRSSFTQDPVFEDYFRDHFVGGRRYLNGPAEI
ncbi:NlpC/P60 family protein [Nanoarchaeota archaeon]